MGFEVIDRISHWEKGRAQPGLINVIKLCKVYRVTVDDLYRILFLSGIEFWVG